MVVIKFSYLHVKVSLPIDIHFALQVTLYMFCSSVIALPQFQV